MHRMATEATTRRQAARGARVAIAVTLGSLLVAGSAQAAPAAVVAMWAKHYSSRVVEIEAGEAVRWRNPSRENHTVVSSTGLFSSGALFPRDRYTHRFADPGTFRYHCTLHPGMRGTVRVGTASRRG